MRNLLAALLLALTCISSPARAEWRRAESPNFILYGTGSESSLRERILLLEDFDKLLRTVTTVTEPPSRVKLHVYIMPNHGGLELLRPTPASVVGFYTPTPDGIAAFVDGSAGSEGNETLFHEYAHHFMYQYRPNAYPSWYIEGFAEFFSTVRIRSGSIDIGDFSRGRVATLQTTWMPIERVLLGAPEGLNPDAMAAYYAESWLAVHWFYSTPERQAALARYLVQSRLDPRTALQASTGMDFQRFDAALHDYIRAGFVRMRRMERASGAAVPSVTVTQMPRSADQLMVYEAALRIGIDDDHQQPYLQQIRQAAASYPEDPFARRLLARAEAQYGDGAAADRLLEPLLAAAPNDAQLLYIKGLRHLAAARRDNAPDSEIVAARDWLGRAARADPDYFPALVRWADSMRGERLTREVGDAVIRAHELAPQVGGITMNAAAMHMNRGEFDEAARLLRPLASDPHDTGMARAARQLLQQLMGARVEHVRQQLDRGEIQPNGQAPPKPASD